MMIYFLVSKIVPVILVDEFHLLLSYNRTTTLFQMLGLSVLLFPILLIRDLSGLRYFSLMGFLGVFYTTFVDILYLIFII